MPLPCFAVRKLDPNFLFASKNEARIPLSSWSSSLRAEDVWNPFRQYQHYYSTASYSIPGLRPRVQYWSFRRRRPAAAVARSQKQRRQYRAGASRGLFTLQILVDQLTLLQPGRRQMMTNTLLFGPPDFRNFHRLCSTVVVAFQLVSRA